MKDAYRPDLSKNIPGWVSYLVSAAASAPSADNGQPWRFTWDGSALTLTLDEVRAQGLGTDHPAIWLAMGACIENLMQAAVGIRMPPTAICQLPSGDCAGAIVTVAPEPASLSADTGDVSYFHARHTSRVKFKREPLPSGLLGDVCASSEGGARVRAFSDRAEILRIAGLVRAASEARFQNAEIHRWLGASLRMTEAEAARGDGLDLGTLALPPGGRLLMRLIADWRRMSVLNKMGAYKLLAAVEASSVPHCGAILAITAPSWKAQSMLSAGRLMERTWLLLNGHGFAVHPYFVLSDQLYRHDAGRLPDGHGEPIAQLADSSLRLMDDAQQRPAVLLRVGRSPRKVPRSRRLPLTEVLTLSIAPT